MLLYWLLMVLLICKLMGGKFNQLTQYKLLGAKWLALIIVVQLLVVLSLRQALPWLAGILLIAAYVALLVIGGINRNLPGIKIVWVGLFLNFLVIAANGGMMPVTEESLNAIGRSHQVVQTSSAEAVPVANTKVALLKEPKLLPLGDVIVIPLPGRLASAVSIGDLLIGMGLAWFCIKAMGVTWPPRPGYPRKSVL